MALSPSNSSNFEQLALKGLKCWWKCLCDVILSVLLSCVYVNAGNYCRFSINTEDAFSVQGGPKNRTVLEVCNSRIC